MDAQEILEVLLDERLHTSILNMFMDKGRKTGKETVG